MQPLSREKYRKYKMEAVKRGETVYERNDAASIFHAAFYEADKASRKYNFVKVASLTLAGSAVIASATTLFGLLL